MAPEMIMNPSKTVIIYSASNWVSPSASMYNEMHLGVTTTGGDAATTGRTCPRIAPCRHNDAAHRALGNGRRVEGMRGAARVKGMNRGARVVWVAGRGWCEWLGAGGAGGTHARASEIAMKMYGYAVRNGLNAQPDVSPPPEIATHSNISTTACVGHGSPS